MVNWWHSVWWKADHKLYRNPGVHVAEMHQSILSLPIPEVTEVQMEQVEVGGNILGMTLSMESVPTGHMVDARCDWILRNSNSCPLSRPGFCAHHTETAQTAEMRCCWGSGKGWTSSWSEQAGGRWGVLLCAEWSYKAPWIVQTGLHQLKPPGSHTGWEQAPRMAPGSYLLGKLWHACVSQLPSCWHCKGTWGCSAKRALECWRDLKEKTRHFQ